MTPLAHSLDFGVWSAPFNVGRVVAVKCPSCTACDKMNQANGVDTDKLEKSSEEAGADTRSLFSST